MQPGQKPWPSHIPTKQGELSSICPFKCHVGDSRAFCMTNWPAPHVSRGEVHSRCFFCNTFWTVNHEGKITQIVKPLNAEFCPKCLESKTGPDHVCGEHLTIKLL